MTQIKSYYDLKVWQGAIGLVVKIYQLTEKFPKHELFGLSSQMQRSAVSIPSNIAEGHTRSHKKEFLQFLSIAQGSLAELKTQIEIAYRLKYLSQNSLSPLLDHAVLLSKQLYALRNALLKQKLIPNPQPLSP